MNSHTIVNHHGYKFYTCTLLYRFIRHLYSKITRLLTGMYNLYMIQLVLCSQISIYIQVHCIVYRPYTSLSRLEHVYEYSYFMTFSVFLRAALYKYYIVRGKIWHNTFPRGTDNESIIPNPITRTVT